jgi:hypothetical protein
MLRVLVAQTFTIAYLGMQKGLRAFIQPLITVPAVEALTRFAAITVLHSLYSLMLNTLEFTFFLINILIPQEDTKSDRDWPKCEDKTTDDTRSEVEGPKLRSQCVFVFGAVLTSFFSVVSSYRCVS